METQTPTKYFLYTRKSSEDKGKQILSLESQTNEMKKLAFNLGLQIEKVYTESKSAKMPDNRPLFSEMVKTIKNNERENYGIICWKIDRLSRNPIDSATIQWLLQQGRLKTIQTADRQYLPSDNVLLFNVESSMANQYILDLSKNVKRGQKTKLEKGGWPNMAPIGYLNDGKGGIIIDPERGRYIQKAFKLYTTGTISIKTIAEQLYREGFRSRKGLKYHKSKVHQFLSNPFYCGIMVKDDQKYLGNHESIISKQLFDEAQVVLNKKTHIKAKTIPFAFKGLLKCSQCSCALTASKKREKHVYYYCTNGKNICNEHKTYLKEDYLSTELSKAFDQLTFDEEMIELCYLAKKEEATKTFQYQDEIQADLNKKLKTIKDRRNELLNIFLDKTISKEVYKTKDKELNNEEINILQNIQQVKAQSKSKDQNTLERIKNLFLTPNQLKKAFSDSTFEKQGKILFSLLWNVEIKDKKIAKFSFKEPYNVLAKIENKSDFKLVRKGWDSNPRYLAVYTLSKRAH